METCKYCKFYAEPGLCRRYPPTWAAYTMDEPKVESICVFAEVTETLWCGEFKEKEEKARG